MGVKVGVSLVDSALVAGVLLARPLSAGHIQPIKKKWDRPLGFLSRSTRKW